jgi:heme/copper-type cytochrome/quinol oxidase subunit 2
MLNDILTVFLTAITILTIVILAAYMYCMHGRWQEQRKYKKFDRETKVRIMKTIVKR